MLSREALTFACGWERDDESKQNASAQTAMKASRPSLCLREQPQKLFMNTSGLGTLLPAAFGARMVLFGSLCAWGRG